SKGKSYGTDEAPENHCKNDSCKAAPRTTDQKKLREFTARGITAANDKALERETGEQKALEKTCLCAICPGLHYLSPRQEVISASKAGPLRIGSATGRPRRALSRAISSSASSAERAAVLK